MNVKNLKKYALALTLAAGFVVVAGPINLFTVQAQDRRYNQDRRGNREDQGRGYRDGLGRGQKDARDRRHANFNNFEHFWGGNRQYKQGFRRGYNIGYRQHPRW